MMENDGKCIETASNMQTWYLAVKFQGNEGKQMSKLTTGSSTSFIANSIVIFHVVV